MAKNGGVDAMRRRICRPIVGAMGQKAAGAGRRTAILQPAIPKSDRLLEQRTQNGRLFHVKQSPLKPVAQG